MRLQMKPEGFCATNEKMISKLIAYAKSVATENVNMLVSWYVEKNSLNLLQWFLENH